MTTANDLGIAPIGTAQDIIGGHIDRIKCNMNKSVKIYEEAGITFFEMIRPNNFHVHLREIDQLQFLLQYSAVQFGHILAMPNTIEPLTTVESVLEYSAAIAEESMQILRGVWARCGNILNQHVALYLTDNTTEDEIWVAYDSGIFVAKLYPGGATTNSDNGVTNIHKMWKIFALMEELGMKLSIHCEVVDSDVDFFDREKIFISKYLRDIVKDFPKLYIIFEHVSTQEGVEFVKEMSKYIAATITPQHMLFNRNDLLVSGMCPSKFCFPVVNRKSDQEAIIAAATSGHSKFFLGTDSAPHSDELKYCEKGKGGCLTEPYAIPLYMKAFEQAGALDDRFEAFASFNGTDFYGLPRNTAKLRMVRKPQKVVNSIEIGRFLYATPIMAGEELEWSIAR